MTVQAVRNQIDRLLVESSDRDASLADLRDVLSATEYHRAYIVTDFADGWGAPSAETLVEITRRWEAVRDEITDETLEDDSWKVIRDLAPFSELDDNALYQLYRDEPNGAGQRAFATFVERFRPVLTSYIAKTLRVCDPATGDEIAHKVFARLANVADKFDAGKSSVAAWSFWLAKHELKQAA